MGRALSSIDGRRFGTEMVVHQPQEVPRASDMPSNAFHRAHDGRERDGVGLHSHQLLIRQQLGGEVVRGKTARRLDSESVERDGTLCNRAVRSNDGENDFTARSSCPSPVQGRGRGEDSHLLSS